MTTKGKPSALLGARKKPRVMKKPHNHDRKNSSPWGKTVKMTDGSEVETGTAEHREKVRRRHEAGTPAPGKGQVVYNEFHAVNARKFVAHGLPDFEICEIFGVSLRTLALWKQKHPEFAEAMLLRDADGVYVDDSVKRSLLNRANGYSYHSEKVFYDKDAGPVRVAIVEHVPPDVGAQAFWLKNRLPDQWSDRREVNVNARVAAITSGVSQQDALALFRAVLDGATIDLDAVEDDSASASAEDSH